MPDVYEWLRGLGIEFMPMPMWVERGLHGGGNSVPRFHLVWGTGRALAETLVARLLAHPRRELLELKFGHRVDALVREGGRVAGFAGAIEPDGGRFEVAAESVIVAAGGINGDIERVRRHWHADWGRPPAVILNGSHRFADGTLHDAAAAAGAQVTHLDWQWNYAAGIRHWRPRKPGHGLSLVPPKSALWLNSRGERIGPVPLVSGFDTHDLVARICAEPGGYSWQLLNRRIALKELAVSGAEFNPAIRERRRLRVALDLLFGNRWLYDELTRNSEDIVVADTLPELVERMNALNGDDVVDHASVERAVAALRRRDRPRRALPQRRAAAAHRLGAALAGGSAAHLRVPEDPRPAARAAGRDPRVHHQPQEHGRHRDRSRMPRAGRRGPRDRRTVRRGRSGGLRRRRHERQARPRGDLSRRLPVNRPRCGARA